MPFEKSPLQKALADAVEDGYDYLCDHRVVPKGAGDAEALAAALSELSLSTCAPDIYGSRLWALAKTYEVYEDSETEEALRQRTLPELIKAFDRGLDIGADPDDLLLTVHTLLLEAGDVGDAIDRVAAAASRFPESPRWLEIVYCYVEDGDDETTPVVVERLRGSYPEGNAGLWYLSWCNTVCRRDPAVVHPYDTSEGHEHLRAWLELLEPPGDPAVVAAIALGFVAPPACDLLLARAEAHPVIEVRLAAAFARARQGRPHGSARLTMFCRDPGTSQQAKEYLTELGLASEIPEAAQTLAAEALSEVAYCLGDANDGPGRNPSELEVVDSRVLVWPTEEDEREVFIVRYRCPRDAEHPDELVGYVAYTGVLTYALVGEAHIGLPPIEVYALHCCWELEELDDPRAPDERSIDAGLAILRKYNPGLE